MPVYIKSVVPSIPYPVFYEERFPLVVRCWKIIVKIKKNMARNNLYPLQKINFWLLNQINFLFRIGVFY